MADHYEYKGLCEKAKGHAITKLKENPTEINEHIENFRNIVKSKPHLDHPTDSNFLLKFLRVAKFNLKKALVKLDNFCTIKDSPRGAPVYFDHIKSDDPVVEELLGAPIFVPLGQNEAHEFVVLIRFDLWNLNTTSFKELMNFIFMSLDLLVEDEEMQIYGFRMIYDFTNVSRNGLAHFSDPIIMRNLCRIGHESHVFRLKGEIFYNAPELFDINYAMYTFFKHEKKKRNVLNMRGDIKNLAEKIPGIEKIMPTEYGGEAGPISELGEKWKAKFKHYFKDGDPRPRVSVDESKRPEEGHWHFSHFGEYEGPRIEME